LPAASVVTVVEPLIASLPVTVMSLAVSGDGGTKKSPAFTGPQMGGVETDRRPEVAPPGTVACQVELVALEIVPARPLKSATLVPRSNAEPEMATEAPATPMVGVKLVMRDAQVTAAVTVKDLVEVTVLPETVTETVPVVAPEGP
jgi:hypothetical protein